MALLGFDSNGKLLGSITGDGSGPGGGLPANTVSKYFFDENKNQGLLQLAQTNPSAFTLKDNSLLYMGTLMPVVGHEDEVLVEDFVKRYDEYQAFIEDAMKTDYTNATPEELTKILAQSLPIFMGIINHDLFVTLWMLKNGVPAPVTRLFK